MREKIEKENFSYITSYGYPIATGVSLLAFGYILLFGSPFVQSFSYEMKHSHRPASSYTVEELQKKEARFESLG